jgi:hypothetical protein
VRDIADQDADRFLKGFVAFDKYSSLSGYGVVPQNHTASPAASEAIPLPFDLVDVMLGPL